MLLDKTNSKVCRKCGERKSLDSLVLNKSCKFGRDSLCKICVNKYTNFWNKKHTPEIMPSDYTKKCGVCGFEKLAEINFGKYLPSYDGYKNNCKDCITKLHIKEKPENYVYSLENENQICTKCQETKKLKFFAKSIHFKKWVRSVCKECENSEKNKLFSEIQNKEGNSGIYLVQDKTLNRLKIGYSKNVKNRFLQLSFQNPNDPKLLSIKKGTQKDEKLLHYKYFSIKIFAEWFDFHSDILKDFDIPFGDTYTGSSSYEIFSTKNKSVIRKIELLNNSFSEINGKTCPKCFLFKNKDMYYNSSNTKDGLEFSCKLCSKKRNRIQKSGVYLFYSKGMGKIKLGFSVDVMRRFWHIRGANSGDLYILSILEGDMDYEIKLHQKLKAHRYKGEWYNVSKDIFDMFNLDVSIINDGNLNNLYKQVENLIQCK